MAHRKRREPVQVASAITIELTGIAYGGEAVGRHEGQVVFVAGGIPGEIVTVDLIRERGDLLRGVLREVVRASPDRVAPPCPYFSYCGGCQWQHVDYPAQLALKARIVAEQLARIGGFTDPPVRPVLGSPREWQYRNNARFSAGRHGHLGFTRPHSHRFLAVDRCLIAHESINEVLREVQGGATGVHQVVMRVGEHTGDFLLYPQLAGDRYAANELTEELLGCRFYISFSSFFQVNTPQAERLAELVLDKLSLRGTEHVVDAYCGVGTFAILVASKAGRIIGIEESPSAVKNAERNALRFPNVSFRRGKTEAILPALGDAVDAVVLDPARAGCAKEVIEGLARLLPARIVYVSCDPATLARDLRLLCDAGYTLIEVQPVDMFPQTYHVENLATLVRRE